MKIKSISHHKMVSLVINYNKIQVDFSATGELDEDEDVSVASKTLREIVNTQISDGLNDAAKDVKAILEATS